MNTSEINGFYGTNNRTTIFVVENRSGSKWYCVEGSENVNKTFDLIEEGVNVETLTDCNTFHWEKPIYSVEELIEAIEA